MYTRRTFRITFEPRSLSWTGRERGDPPLKCALIKMETTCRFTSM